MIDFFNLILSAATILAGLSHDVKSASLAKTTKLVSCNIRSLNGEWYISTKFHLQQENKIIPVKFLRHYYDVFKLLKNDRVLQFIGTDNYHQHKQLRFRGQHEIIIKNNPAFTMENTETKNLYSAEFKKKSAIYFGVQPTFDQILERIQGNIERL